MFAEFAPFAVFAPLERLQRVQDIYCISFLVHHYLDNVSLPLTEASSPRRLV